MFPDLIAAAEVLAATDNFVLSLPVSAVLAQRFRLPSVEDTELREMVRLQVEKALPFPAEEVTTDFEIVGQDNGECVVSAVAVQNQRLHEIAQPLLERNLVPQKVTLYAAQRAASQPALGQALLIYSEGGALVSAISENRTLSFARNLGGSLAGGVEFELPQFALSAELQGISTAFETILLDEKCYQLRDEVERALTTRPEILGLETPPAPTQLNLLPQSWREQRSRAERRGQWRKRLALAAAIYLGLIALLLLQLGYLRFRLFHLERSISRDASRTAFVQGSAAGWRTLEPALDPHFYPIEILMALFESLPSPDVRITAYNQSARQISIEGEAPSTALAYQFVEKVKKNGNLQRFAFEMQSPRILPNEHAQFRLEGKTR